MIQTISAVDKDEPLDGHRFNFALDGTVAGNLNFTLRDNKGATAFLCHSLMLFKDSGLLFIVNLYKSARCTHTQRICECLMLKAPKKSLESVGVLHLD